MSAYIIQINTFEIREGMLEGFRSSVRQAQDFARENDPVLMAEMFIDEENMIARALLVHRDSAAILEHWEVSARHMSDVMDYCRAKGVEILGQPSDEVREGLWKFREVGVPVTMTPHFAGFSRLADAKE